MLLQQSLCLKKLVHARCAMSGVAAAVDSGAVRSAKKEARSALKEALKHVTPEDMQAESAAIAHHVLSAHLFSSSTMLGVYVHCARLREVDTTAILDAALTAGKHCYVPVVEDKDSNMKLLHLDDLKCLVSVPPYGILEPAPTYTDGSPRQDALASTSGVHLDVLVMPGLGFDATGRRLGRGGGYYDKALGRLKQHAQAAGKEPPLLVALAYKAQMLEAVPVDAHDEHVDIVVTADQVFRCSPRAHSAWPA